MNESSDHWCYLDGADVQCYLQCPTPKVVLGSNIPASPSYLCGLVQGHNHFTTTHLGILLATVPEGAFYKTCNMECFCRDCIAVCVFTTGHTRRRIKIVIKLWGTNMAACKISNRQYPVNTFLIKFKYVCYSVHNMIQCRNTVLESGYIPLIRSGRRTETPLEISLNHELRFLHMEMYIICVSKRNRMHAS